jgi:alpha-galactosidase
MNLFKSPVLRRATLVALAATLAVRGFGATVWLDDLDISKTIQDWGNAQKHRSMDGHHLTLGGKQFLHGVGTHARSTLYIDLKNGAEAFSASVGVDGEITATNASVEFEVLGDGKPLWHSGVMHAGETAKNVDVNVKGVKILALKVSDADDGISYDHADWADAKLEIIGAPPETVIAPPEDTVILTPPEQPDPRITGPAVFGVRLGHPFLFQIPATGERPMRFFARDLPDGLKLDPDSGQITGVLSGPGEFSVHLRASNKSGASQRELKISCGNQIGLTPPMGWNSWNCFAKTVDDKSIRLAADVLVSSGLINHGWNYINIDDCWEGGRDANGRIQSNDRFPDMKALVDYVHAKGLKIGIYSSPGPKTCAGYEASWRHEEADAQQYAAWGFDYLKYDWCSYDKVQDKSLSDRARLMKPYAVMSKALNKVDRDILYSLCQYGDGNVWEWGAQVNGNSWRTTGDITDTWGSMANNGFGSAGHEKFAGPGHWNDPDMLVVGKLGWGNLRPTRLTPNEQYTHLSLWCLLSAPLLIGCDMSQLDPFTLNLLSNDEVLAVDQDPLGKQASLICRKGELEIWAKPMQDGSKAIGLFNRSELAAQITVSWSQLGLAGSHGVRDLWRQKDLGNFADTFNTGVPRHGVALLRVW